MSTELADQFHPHLPYNATDVDDGAMTTAGHQGLGCGLSD